MYRRGGGGGGGVTQVMVMWKYVLMFTDGGSVHGESNGDVGILIMVVCDREWMTLVVMVLMVIGAADVPGWC